MAKKIPAKAVAVVVVIAFVFIVYLQVTPREVEVHVRVEIVSDTEWSGRIYLGVGGGSTPISGTGYKNYTWISIRERNWHGEVCYVEVKRRGTGYLQVEIYVNDKLIAIREGWDIRLSAYI